MVGNQKEASLQGVLSLAGEEEQWLRSQAPPELPAENSNDLERGPCSLPEHLSAKPLPPLVEPAAPAPVEGAAQGAPLVVHAAPGYARSLVTGALVGVGAASLLVGWLAWTVRSSEPRRLPRAAVRALRSTTAAAPPSRLAQAPRPEASTKGSRPPAPVRSTQPRVEPPVEQAPQRLVATVKTESLQPREKPQARSVPAVEERERAPAVNPSPAPTAAPEPSEYDEFDRDFARELGFTKDAVRKVPERKGIKNVWIPPDPSPEIPESLSPADIQKVVVANRSAIAACIRRSKEADPSLKGGRFVVRWSIALDGSTHGIAMETDALRGSALEDCLEGLVRDWRFPRHRAQMEPIYFPFVF